MIFCREVMERCSSLAQVAGSTHCYHAKTPYVPSHIFPLLLNWFHSYFDVQNFVTITWFFNSWLNVAHIPRFTCMNGFIWPNTLVLHVGVSTVSDGTFTGPFLAISEFCIYNDYLKLKLGYRKHKFRTLCQDFV